MVLVVGLDDIESREKRCKTSSDTLVDIVVGLIDAGVIRSCEGRRSPTCSQRMSMGVNPTVDSIPI